eukprot:CAMPEP_0173401904 /NCGR_PEP_ID=MMETSP1356-20130122/52432_1 /TAXON_ID=77927 ORGANISM="Hemiselmis virescens, Strain PCC157" /NCGR_SAMPLE_ID=MMETSP1356 /ASSEMBLY_ACC=CAM_ASM_000847 /LENGTH=85 /DNA_ID=CAMNT_0014362157 /DNA_START=66 /DNA_END=319 /DNA_ORIENTATION=+
MTTAVKVGICISLVLTYPLMMFPVFEILETHWGRALFREPPSQLPDADEEDEDDEEWAVTTPRKTASDPGARRHSTPVVAPRRTT